MLDTIPMPPFARLRGFLASGLAVTLCCSLITGCASTDGPSLISQATSGALESIGLSTPPPEVPDSMKPARNVSFRLLASRRVNTDPQGNPLAVVVRLLKLRQDDAFRQLPYEAFLDAQKQKDALGADLIESRELMLTPGQQLNFDEKVSREAYFIGVVVLFRSPAPGHWRASFASEAASKSGITIGIHSCSLTVGAGAASTQPELQDQHLSSLHCA